LLHHEVQAYSKWLFGLYDEVTTKINASLSPQQIPLVPRQLEYALEELAREQDQAREQELGRDQEAPAPSLPTSSSKSRGQKTKLRWREHGRHQLDLTDKVHVIDKVGPEGNLEEPEEVIGWFSNQVSCIVRERVLITTLNWHAVPVDIKGVVWGDVLRKFRYLEEAEFAKCEEYAMHVA
jgi:hypothetical protein